jgi:hypothetical protein
MIYSKIIVYINAGKYGSPLDLIPSKFSQVPYVSKDPILVNLSQALKRIIQLQSSSAKSTKVLHLEPIT